MLDCAFIRFQDGIPVTDASSSLLRGFRAHGVPVHPFSDFEEIRERITPETLVHGWVGDVLKALDQLKIPRPTFSTIPEGDATELMGRSVMKATLRHIRDEKVWPIFVKPVGHKTFTGHVVSSFSDLYTTSHLPDAEPVYVQPKVHFISEHRCFIHWDKTVGVRQYNGDCEVFPDMAVVDEMKQTLLRRQALPCAYSLDVGILPDGKNVLVELNDGFALGSYGLSWAFYLPFVHDRWIELVTPRSVWGNHLVDLYLARKINFHQFQVRFLQVVGEVLHGELNENPGADVERLGHANLIWCEYTSIDEAEESWFRGQLSSRLEPNPTPL